VRKTGRTGAMLIVTDEGERSMVADRGASAALVEGDLPPTIEAGAVLVSGYLLLQAATQDVGVAALSRARAPIVAVEAASWPFVEALGRDRFAELAADVSAVFANEREAEALTGATGIRACRMLGERFALAAVKGGADGAALCVDGTLVEREADAVTELDPTGAGDAFDGVLLARLARGDEPAEALAAACHAGGLVAASELTWPEEGE
jgi:sugar/nucleoside kinase (ribokinase family)